MDRRQMLMGCCGAAVAGGLAPRPLFGMTAQPLSAAGAIDVHYHVETDAVRKLPRGRANARGADSLPDWTPEKAIALMDQQGIAASVISTRIVGVKVPTDAAGLSAFARGANEDGAAIVRGNPKRFRYFAFMPMPFVEETLAELKYALDVLKADGIYVYTSYDGKWLGDPSFDPIWAECNRRNAIVYTHPSGSTCCAMTVPNLNPQIVEYGTDTTRTIADLIFSGTADKYPDIRFIFSHAGGSMPFLYERFEREGNARKELKQGAVAPLRRFFYDTAQAANPYALGTLMKVVPTSQILYGSDYPWRDPAEQLAAIGKMGIGASAQEAILTGNARRLLPVLHG